MSTDNHVTLFSVWWRRHDDHVVFVIALKHEDGKLTSARLYAEKDGIKPPM